MKIAVFSFLMFSRSRLLLHSNLEIESRDEIIAAFCWNTDMIEPFVSFGASSIGDK